MMVAILDEVIYGLLVQQLPICYQLGICLLHDVTRLCGLHLIHQLGQLRLEAIRQAFLRSLVFQLQVLEHLVGIILLLGVQILDALGLELGMVVRGINL